MTGRPSRQRERVAAYRILAGRPVFARLVDVYALTPTSLILLRRERPDHTEQQAVKEQSA